MTKQSHCLKPISGVIRLLLILIIKAVEVVIGGVTDDADTMVVEDTAEGAVAVLPVVPERLYNLKHRLSNLILQIPIIRVWQHQQAEQARKPQR